MRRAKVLFASSDPDAIDTFVRNLSGLGYDVVPCTRGATALRMVEEHHFDIAIVSIGLIGLNGFEICRTMRERFDDSELPIVLRAERDSEEWRLAAFGAGANSFAFEPILFDRLDSVMRNLLKFKASHEEQMPVGDALRLMDLMYADSSRDARPADLWPRDFDHEALARYAETLVTNYLDVAAIYKTEVLGYLRLLMSMAERMGTFEVACERLEQLTQGTCLQHLLSDLRRRFQSRRPLGEGDSACPEAIEALAVLLGFASHRAHSDVPSAETFRRMRATGPLYDERLLKALESIVDKDEFLDTVFSADPTAGAPS